MRYVCCFCGLTSTDAEKIEICEAKGSSAQFSVGDQIVFWSGTFVPCLTNPETGIKLRGVIEKITYELLTHKVAYSVFVGDYPILRHRNCTYGGITEQQIRCKI